MKLSITSPGCKAVTVDTDKASTLMALKEAAWGALAPQLLPKGLLSAHLVLMGHGRILSCLDAAGGDVLVGATKHLEEGALLAFVGVKGGTPGSAPDLRKDEIFVPPEGKSLDEVQGLSSL